MRVIYDSQIHFVVWQGPGKDGVLRYLIKTSYYAKQAKYVDASECEIVPETVQA